MTVVPLTQGYIEVMAPSNYMKTDLEILTNEMLQRANQLTRNKFEGWIVTTYSKKFVDDEIKKTGKSIVEILNDVALRESVVHTATNSFIADNNGSN